MSVTYHIKVKKDYAASLIEELQKADAIDVIKETDSDIVQDWHVEEVQRRVNKYKNAPDLSIDEDEVFKVLDAE